MGEPRPIIYSKKPQQGSNKRIITTVAVQPTTVTLSHLTPAQQTSKSNQQQIILTLAGVHPPASNSVQPIYVNLGGGGTTVTTSSSISGQPVVTSAIQQQQVNKPVLINISSSSRVGNQPGGAIALPTGQCHPGGGIALPAGLRLVVPATAGAFSGNLINISSVSGTRILTAIPASQALKTSQASLTTANISQNVIITKSSPNLVVASSNPGQTKFLAPRIIGTIGRPINIANLRAPGSFNQNIVQPQTRVTPVRSVSNQVLPTAPRPQQIEIKTSSPSKAQDTPKVLKGLNIGASKQQPIVLNHNNLITNPDGTKSLLIQRGGTQQLVKLQPVTFPISKEPPRPQIKVSKVEVTSPPVLNVVGAKLANVKIVTSNSATNSDKQDIDNNEHNSTTEEIIDDSSTALDLSKTAKKSEKNVEHVKPITPPKIPTQSVVFNLKNQGPSVKVKSTISPSSTNIPQSLVISPITKTSSPTVVTSQIQESPSKSKPMPVYALANNKGQALNVVTTYTNLPVSSSSTLTVKGAKTLQIIPTTKGSSQQKQIINLAGSQIRIQNPTNIQQIIVPKQTKIISTCSSEQVSVPVNKFSVSPQPTPILRASLPQSVSLASIIQTSKGSPATEIGKLAAGNQIIKAANGQQYIIRNATILPRSGCPSNLPPGGQVIQLATPIQSTAKINFKSPTTITTLNASVTPPKMTVAPPKTTTNVSIISPTKQQPGGPPNVIHINIPVTGISSSMPLPFPLPISTATISSEVFTNTLPSESSMKLINPVKPDVSKKETQILNPASLKGLKPVPKHVLENSSFAMTKNPLTEQLSIPVTMTNFKIMPTSVGGKVAAQHAQTVVAVTGAQQLGQPATFHNSNLMTNPVNDSSKNQINTSSTNNRKQSSAAFQGSEFALPKHVMRSTTSDNALEIEKIIKNHKGILSSCSPQELKGAKVVTYSLSNIKSQMPGKSEASNSQHVKTEPVQSSIPSQNYHNFPGLNITVLPKNTDNKPQFVKVDQVQEPLIQQNQSPDRTNQGISTVNNITFVGSPTYKLSNISPNMSVCNADMGSYNQPAGRDQLGQKLIASQESPKQNQQFFVHDGTTLVRADDLPGRSPGEYLIQQPVFNQHPVMTNSQIILNMPNAIPSPNKGEQIMQNQVIQGSPTPPTFAMTSKPPQMNLIPIQGIDPSGKTLVPTTMFNFVPVPQEDLMKQTHQQQYHHHQQQTADVAVSEVQTLVYSQTTPQEQTIIASTHSPPKPKKSRAKKHRESLKQKIQKIENALNVQHVSNIMAITNYQNQESRHQIPENLEDEFLEALEEECSGVEPNKAKMDIYKRFYNHPGCVNNIRYINGSNMETYLDRSMLDNKKYLHSLLRKHIKLKRSRSELINGKPMNNNKAKPEKKDKKKKVKETKLSYIEMKTLERRKLWSYIVKKEIGKSSKARSFILKEKIGHCKRLATACHRVQRHKEAVNQKIARENMWKAKRLAKEIQAYWKKSEREEKQQKRAQEKVEQEQRKLDIEFLEAKRQQRKLNYLITQTELYAHFMSGKITGCNVEGETQENILSRLNSDVADQRLKELDYYDEEEVKAAALSAVTSAARSQEASKLAFDSETNLPHSRRHSSDSFIIPSSENSNSLEITSDNFEDLRCVPKTSVMSESAEMAGERPQPSIFQGTLKSYQLKGMNWLCSLYDQGINGILADEMGLGKTVQSLAFLAYIAETYGIWGPFLVITPASTLHNWQQELGRFLPDFKTIPYWGSPQERKVLRGFWSQENLHTKESSFHIVVTSYQIVVSDYKYFNKQRWQYMVLDEAQAIKSANSQRWKMLLEFKCRGRLLLSGTPIQNSMAELWSLLHFVMPSLFDSHYEFKEWFSKDIEGSAVASGTDGSRGKTVDEKQMSRLHMILKPFMLRRIKKDVENELTDKVELLVYCPLTIRQKLLYAGLKQNIRIEEVLAGLGLGSGTSGVSSLMNLVMQFRKVCNHPELFERREPKSPLHLPLLTQPVLPRLLILDPPISAAQHPKHSIFQAHKVHRKYLEVDDHSFDFLKMTGLSAGELENCTWSLYHRWLLLISSLQTKSSWDTADIFKNNDLVFTGYTSSFLSHCDILVYSMPETIAHRIIRSKHLVASKHLEEGAIPLVEEVPHKPHLPEIRPCERVECPPFLLRVNPAVSACPIVPDCSSRTAEYRKQDHDRVWVGPDRFSTAKKLLLSGQIDEKQPNPSFHYIEDEKKGLEGSRPEPGWSRIVVPDKNSLISDAGKLMVLDGLLTRLKEEGHRVLIYTQMTKMIDLLEEFMSYRQHSYMRLDGSSKIHERRDMVADFQNRQDIFVFLLSTRAGGLGINLTAADTVIFYDSDWNPTVDQQAMDRAHRLGQTKQVTVYRLICKGTIEDRILQRAREKSEIHNMVIKGGSIKGKSDLKPKEVVSLLLDDEELKRNMARANNGGKQLISTGNYDDISSEQLIKVKNDTHHVKFGDSQYFRPPKKRKKFSKNVHGDSKKIKNCKMPDDGLNTHLRDDLVATADPAKHNGMILDSNSLNF